MKYRVGRYTTGVSLIIIGFLTLFHQVADVPWTENWLKYWPLILIGYGIEYLLASRREQKTSFDVGGAIFITVLLLFISSFGLFNGVFTDGAFILGGERYTFEEEVVIQRENLQSLIADTVNGNVTVIPSQGDAIKVHAVYKVRGNDEQEAAKRKKELKLDVHEEGNRLIAKIDYPKAFAFGFPIRMDQVDLNIQAPADLIIDAETTNGTVQISDMKQLQRVETTNGKIFIFNSKGNAILETTNGKIEVENFSGSLVADNTNGSIVVTGEVQGEWKFETTNGTIEIGIPENGSYQYDFSNTNGSIRTPGIFESGRKDKHHYQGEINGGNNTIELETTNGNIEVSFR